MRLTPERDSWLEKDIVFMADNEQQELTIPHELAILPLRGVVVYPMMWLPLTIGQERSIHLVDDALAEDARPTPYRVGHFT